MCPVVSAAAGFHHHRPDRCHPAETPGMLELANSTEDGFDFSAWPGSMPTLIASRTAEGVIAIPRSRGLDTDTSGCPKLICSNGCLDRRSK